MDIIRDITRRVEYNVESGVSSKISSDIQKALFGGKDQPKCPKCGKPITNSLLRFCPNCGTKLTVDCKNCNLAFPLATKFCARCGAPLE